MSGSGEVLSGAAQYVDALPADAKFLVWPSRQVPHEVVGDEPLKTAVTRYRLERRHVQLTGGFGARPLIKVSVIALGEGGPSVAVRGSLAGSYRTWIAQMPIPADGCAAHVVSSRDTWAGLAVVLVDRTKLAVSSSDELYNCVSAALDYVTGFPPPNKEFHYRLMPAADLRRVALDAAYAYALEREGASGEVERTRAGMTPLPNRECIASKLRSASR